MQDLDIDRLALVAAGKQPVLRTGQTPVGPQTIDSVLSQRCSVRSLPPLPCSTRMTIRSLSTELCAKI